MKNMKKYKLNKLRILLSGIGLFFISIAFAQPDAFKEDENTRFERGDGGETTQLEMTGAVSLIQGADLKTYPDLSLSNTLQGRAAGLIVRMTNNGLGNNTANLFIRGQHRNGSEQAIVVVDGIERDFDDLIPEEIESIEVMKDAVAKILYGPAAANGVIVVKTKRGKVNERVLRFNAELGVMQATRTPKFLNSYDYATLYNEARHNDGLPDFYLPYQMEGYKNSTGVNDTFFPDVDYYNYFMKDQNIYRKVSMEAYGGNQRFKYSLIGSYMGGSGFEKVGNSSDLNRINLRGNLDISVTDYLKVVADVAARMENRSWAAINNNNFFLAMSTNYPNEYPLTIPAEAMAMTPDSSGVPYFGASFRKNANLLADMKYRGNSSERYVSSQTNLGLNFDFNKYVKGLTADGYLTFDNYSYLSEELRREYRTYAPDIYYDKTGQLQNRFVLITKLAPNDDISITGNNTRRTSGWRANVGYENDFDLHHLSAILGYRYYKGEQQGASYDIINDNYNLRLNYDYGKRYLAEFNLAYMGTNKFAPGNKYFLSPAGGIGWVISNEAFMSDVKPVNYLKLKAGYGVLGYSGATDFNLFNTTWADGTVFQTGSYAQFTGSTGTRRTNIQRIGNPNLKWEKSAELNIGLEGMFLKDRLSAEINYFNETRSNIIGVNGAKYVGVLGDYTMSENMGTVVNQGIDGSVSWSDKAGDVFYSVGVNFTCSKNKLEKWSEVQYPDEGIRSVGKPTDAIFGMTSLGLFGREVQQISDNPPQAFGVYGIGDIAYYDTNHDGVIDARDQIMIGNSFPRTSLGLDIQLNYKNWGLYLLGTSELGVKKLLNNNYFWNKQDSKYSVLAWDSYHPERNPNGIYPILTTRDGSNSFRSSDFWLEDASFFRLKNVELSYTFPNKKQPESGKGIKVFVRGTNLFVLSKIKDLDPECLDAGLTNYPVTSYYTGGVSFTF